MSIGFADDQQDGVRRIFQDIGYHILHDAGVHADQLLAGHARFAGHAGRDDYNVRIGGCCIVIGHARQRGIEIHQRGGLVHVQHLALGQSLLDVEQDDFRRLLRGWPLRLHKLRLRFRRLQLLLLTWSCVLKLCYVKADRGVARSRPLFRRLVC